MGTEPEPIIFLIPLLLALAIRAWQTQEPWQIVKEAIYFTLLFMIAFVVSLYFELIREIWRHDAVEIADVLRMNMPDWYKRGYVFWETVMDLTSGRMSDDTFGILMATPVVLLAIGGRLFDTARSLFFIGTGIAFIALHYILPFGPMSSSGDVTLTTFTFSLYLILLITQLYWAWFGFRKNLMLRHNKLPPMSDMVI